MKKILVVLPLAAALSLIPSFALSPHLVADIDPRFMSENSDPSSFVPVAGRAVFLTRGEVTRLWGTAGVPGDPVALLPATFLRRSGPVAAGPRAYVTGCDGAACGLWATDGTAAGTIRLIRLPSLGSESLEAVAPAGLPRTLVTFRTDNGTVLWSTNGTPAGTRKVTMAPRSPHGLVGFRAKAWFFGDVAGAHRALFSTDGLPGGTRRIGTSALGSNLTPLGANRMLFYADREIWVTDGTSGGTRRLAALPGRETFASRIVVAGNRAFFFDYDGGRRQLWVTDGTPAGTRSVASTAPDGRGQLLALGTKVAFLARDDIRGQELWSSDGTAAGTRPVKDICPGTCGGGELLGVSALGRIWFAGSTPARGVEIWTSDLTPAGTRPLGDFCPGSCSSETRNFFAVQNLVYFTAGDLNNGRFYASDGTPAGTRQITPFAPYFLEAAPLGRSTIVFTYGDVEHGIEPWISNGTPAGTRFLADLNTVNQSGSNPDSFAAAGGLAFFLADDGVHGRELWSSDGTPAGTQLAFELAPGPAATFAQTVASEAGSRLVLFANRSNTFELIGSDGTPAGSAWLLPEGVRADGRRVRAGDRLFFVGIDDAHGAELWVTDGTPEGTDRLTDLAAPDPFRPEAAGFPVLFGLGDRAIAPVLSDAGGEELLISDGTVDGTRPLGEVLPFLAAPFAKAQSAVAELAGRFWFVAAEAEDGMATLWRTDLSAAGTGPVGPLDLSRDDSGAWSLFPVGEKMFVFGPSPSLSEALWTSDGTAAGTRVVRQTPLLRAVKPVVFANRLWYAGSSFSELWSSDGTAEGTQWAQNAVGHLLEARTLAIVGGRLAIMARNGLFESDGTPEGTLPIDLPGMPNTFDLPAVAAGDSLFFVWRDSEHGSEPWAVRPD